MAFSLLFLNFSGGREFSASEGSAQGRIGAWEEGLALLKGSPVLGVGYRQFEEYYHLATHNSYVQCFSELGLLGYAVFLTLLVLTFRELRSLQKIPEGDPADENLRACASAIELSLVAFLVCCYFAARAYVPMLYWLLGMAAALGDIARRMGRPVAGLPFTGLASRVVVLEVATLVVMKLTVVFAGS